MPLQDIARFVEQEGVGPAAERRGLYEMYILLRRRPVCRPQDAVDIAPLRDQVRIGDARRTVAADDVFGYHRSPHVGYHVRNLVLDERVGVVGASGEQNGDAAGGTAFGQRIAVEGRDTLFVLLLCSEGGPYRPPYRRALHAQSREVFAADGPQFLCVAERHHGRVYRYLRHDGVAHHLRIAGHHRAVVTVAGVGSFRRVWPGNRCCPT